MIIFILQIYNTKRKIQIKNITYKHTFITSFPLQNNYTILKMSISSTSTPVPSRATILQLFKASPELRTEIADVMTEVLRDELAKMKAEISSQLEQQKNAPAATPSQSTIVASVTDLSDLYAAASKEVPDVPLTKWIQNDESGIIYGFPDTIEIDILKRDNDTWLCDIRHEVDVANVVILLRIGQMYKSLNKGSLACIIFTRKITPQAVKIASKCKIRVVQVPPPQDRSY